MDEQQGQQPVANQETTGPGMGKAPQMPTDDKKSFGPIIGIIIIIVILAIGAFYFFSKSGDSAMEATSPDEINAIEEDLNAEPVDESSFEDEMSQLDAELNAEIETIETTEQTQ